MREHKYVAASEHVRGLLGRLATCVFKGPSKAMEAWLLRNCLIRLRERSATLARFLVDGDVHTEAILTETMPEAKHGVCTNHKTRSHAKRQDANCLVKTLTSAKRARSINLVRALPQYIAHCGIVYAPWKPHVEKLLTLVESDDFQCTCVGTRHRWTGCPVGCTKDHAHVKPCGCAEPRHTSKLVRTMRGMFV